MRDQLLPNEDSALIRGREGDGQEASEGSDRLRDGGVQTRGSGLDPPQVTGCGPFQGPGGAATRLWPGPPPGEGDVCEVSC